MTRVGSYAGLEATFWIMRLGGRREQAHTFTIAGGRDRRQLLGIDLGSDLTSGLQCAVPSALGRPTGRNAGHRSGSADAA